MAFIRQKGKYYALVENRRSNGKVVQDVLANMYTCPTIEEAYQYWRKELGRRRRIAGMSFPILTELEQLRAKRNLAALLEHYPAEQARQTERARASTNKQASKGREAAKEREERSANLTTGELQERAALALGLTPKQCNDAAVVKTVYRSLVKIYHPDTGGTGNPQRFREIQEAYEFLSGDTGV